MLKTNLKQAYQTLINSKSYSIINLFGLGVGIAAFLILAQYIQHHMSFDDFHAQKDNIYMLSLEYQSGNQLPQRPASNYPAVGPEIHRKFPEAEKFTRIYTDPSTFIIEANNQSFVETNTYFVDPAFLTMFSFPLKYGNPEEALKNPFSIVLTERAAKKYFGNENPVNKTLKTKINTWEIDYTVTGVLENLPENTIFNSDVFISFSTFVKNNPGVNENWGWTNFYTFLQLNDKANPDALETKFSKLLTQHKGDYYAATGMREEFFLHKLTDIHFKTDLLYPIAPTVHMRLIYFLSIIAAFIVIIAWINFINLTIIQIHKRIKEVGIRKITGATHRQLIGLFFTESFLINILSAFFSLLILTISIPVLADYLEILSGFTITIGFILKLLLVTTFLGIIITGIIPVVVIARISPSSLFRSAISRYSSESRLRGGLIIFQSAISIILIIGVLTVYSQLNYMKNKKLGMNLEQVMIIEGPVYVQDENTFERGMSYLKDELRKKSYISNVSSSWFIPGTDGQGGEGGYIRQCTQDKTQAKSYRVGTFGYNFIDTYGMQLLAGRNFSKSHAVDNRRVIINEAAMKALGFSSPEEAINGCIYFPIGGKRDNTPIDVIGVLKDFHQKSLRSAIEPTIYTLTENASYTSLKITPENLDQKISEMEAVWKKTFPKNPFSYYFMDAFFNQQYTAEKQLGSIVLFFSILAVLISAIGIFSLIIYYSTQKIKEIGVRKVNGANVSEVLILLNKDFVKRIVVSFIIACPVAYYAMNKWLENFAYKTTLSWWIFALAGALALSIALLTVSWQSWRAATRNPVEALRYE